MEELELRATVLEVLLSSELVDDVELEELLLEDIDETDELELEDCEDELLVTLAAVLLEEVELEELDDELLDSPATVLDVLDELELLLTEDAVDFDEDELDEWLLCELQLRLLRELEEVLDDELWELCDGIDMLLCELVDWLLLVEVEEVDDEEDEDSLETDVEEELDTDELELLDEDSDEPDELLDCDVSPATVEEDEVEELAEELVDSSSYQSTHRRPDHWSNSGVTVLVVKVLTYWFAPLTSVSVTRIGMLSGSLIVVSVAEMLTA